MAQLTSRSALCSRCSSDLDSAMLFPAARTPEVHMANICAIMSRSKSAENTQTPAHPPRSALPRGGRLGWAAVWHRHRRRDARPRRRAANGRRCDALRQCCSRRRAGRRQAYTPLMWSKGRKAGQAERMFPECAHAVALAFGAGRGLPVQRCVRMNDCYSVQRS
jgi:hypothetical protein